MYFGFMNNSIGKVVQVERGGPDKIEGELVGIRDDHLVLRTKEHEVIYCASEHIKSVTEPIVLRIEAAQTDSEEGAEQSPVVPIIEAAGFQEVLEIMEGNMVQINHGGPNMARGVLLAVGPQSATIVHDMKEFVHYPTFHIRSVSRIYEIVQNQENKENKEKEEKESSEK